MRIHVEQVERMNNSKISIPGIISVAGAWIKLPQQINPQPGGLAFHSSSGSYPSTCPTWVALPVATLRRDSIGAELEQVSATKNYIFQNSSCSTLATHHISLQFLSNLIFLIPKSTHVSAYYKF
jgi:hypothetical protein